MAPINSSLRHDSELQRVGRGTHDLYGEPAEVLERQLVGERLGAGLRIHRDLGNAAREAPLVQVLDAAYLASEHVLELDELGLAGEAGDERSKGEIMQKGKRDHLESV